MYQKGKLKTPTQNKETENYTHCMRLFKKTNITTFIELWLNAPGIHFSSYSGEHGEKEDLPKCWYVPLSAFT